MRVRAPTADHTSARGVEGGQLPPAYPSQRFLFHHKWYPEVARAAVGDMGEVKQRPRCRLLDTQVVVGEFAREAHDQGHRAAVVRQVPPVALGIPAAAAAAARDGEGRHQHD